MQRFFCSDSGWFLGASVRETAALFDMFWFLLIKYRYNLRELLSDIIQILLLQPIAHAAGLCLLLLSFSWEALNDQHLLARHRPGFPQALHIKNAWTNTMFQNASTYLQNKKSGKNYKYNSNITIYHDHSLNIGYAALSRNKNINQTLPKSISGLVHSSCGILSCCASLGRYSFSWALRPATWSWA